MHYYYWMASYICAVEALPASQNGQSYPHAQIWHGGGCCFCCVGWHFCAKKTNDTPCVVSCVGGATQ